MEELMERICDLLEEFAEIRIDDAEQLVGGTVGKRYEAWVLANVIEELVDTENFRVVHVFGQNGILCLKGSPGRINPNYPRFDVYRNGEREPCATLWTDVEFAGISYIDGRTNGEYHELDIVMCDYGADGYPRNTQIWLGIECKCRGSSPKGMLREILGVRRELSFSGNENDTNFTNWPCDTVPADPASCLLFYSIDEKPSNDWIVPGVTFGVQFVHLSLEDEE